MSNQAPAVDPANENHGVENDDEKHDTNIHVSIYNEDDGETSTFHAGRGNTLAKVIDKFFVELGRGRRPDDRLRCEDDGEDVFQFTTLTFKDYLDGGHCADLKWTFVGGTGGANC